MGKAKTALDHVRSVILPTLPAGVKESVAFALRRYLHPQERTNEFHRFYGAPIHRNKPNRRMDHMTPERHAFRLGFMLEEYKEILRDGFGIEMECEFKIVGRQHQEIFYDLEAAVHESTHREAKEVIDGLGDLNVVVNGYAVELGVDMDHVDREVAASNFTKPDENGNPIVNKCRYGYDGVSDETRPYCAGMLGGNGCRDSSHWIDPNQPLGKVLKGPNFMKPNMEQFVQEDSE